MEKGKVYPSVWDEAAEAELIALNRNRQVREPERLFEVEDMKLLNSGEYEASIVYNFQDRNGALCRGVDKKVVLTDNEDTNVKLLSVMSDRYEYDLLCQNDVKNSTFYALEQAREQGKPVGHVNMSSGLTDVSDIVISDYKDVLKYNAEQDKLEEQYKELVARQKKREDRWFGLGKKWDDFFLKLDVEMEDLKLKRVANDIAHAERGYRDSSVKLQFYSGTKALMEKTVAPLVEEAKRNNGYLASMNMQEERRKEIKEELGIESFELDFSGVGKKRGRDNRGNSR